MKTFLQEGYSRLKSDTPIWFKKLGKIGIACAGTGGALIAPDIVDNQSCFTFCHIRLRDGLYRPFIDTTFNWTLYKIK